MSCVQHSLIKKHISSKLQVASPNNLARVLIDTQIHVNQLHRKLYGMYYIVCKPIYKVIQLHSLLNLCIHICFKYKPDHIRKLQIIWKLGVSTTKQRKQQKPVGMFDNKTTITCCTNVAQIVSILSLGFVPWLWILTHYWSLN